MLKFSTFSRCWKFSIFWFSRARFGFRLVARRALAPRIALCCRV